MSVPIAVTGLTPKRRIRSGVIRVPPPMPVMPTSAPMPKPKTMIAGSMSLAPGGSRRRQHDLGPADFRPRGAPRPGAGSLGQQLRSEADPQQGPLGLQQHGEEP